MKRSLIHKLGLLGIISLLSYTIAVIFSPLAYPGYDWMSQAVSDLSAASSPSRDLWNQLSSAYGACGIVCIMMTCVYIQNKLTRKIRIGIYLFTIMYWISAIGYGMFPLTQSGYANTFQDIMHMVVTVFVVVLSLLSLVFILIGGYQDKRYSSLSKWALLALILMLIGPLGMQLLPTTYFGIVERFSLFAATGFNAILGFYLYNGFFEERKKVLPN